MKDVDNKLRELAVRHAEISHEIKTNLERASIELRYCKNGDFDVEDMAPYSTCLNHAYYTVERLNREIEDDEWPETYDHILANYGCRHCITARKLKKHVSALRSERGRIHSAITNIGKTL